jgi:hypothetical protein
MHRSLTENDNSILLVTSFSQAPGGVTSYIRTLQRYCRRKGIRCDCVSIEDLPTVRWSLIPLHAVGQIVGALVGTGRTTMSWVLKVLGLVLGIRLALFLSKRNYAHVVAMDVISSWAVNPDVLIVHGAMADEVARQVSPFSAFRFGCIVETRGYQAASKVIAVDPALQARMSRFHRHQAAMIPNPVDLKEFMIRDRYETKRGLGFSPRNRLVAFAGHFPEKYAEQIPNWRFDIERIGFATVYLHGIPYELMPLYLNAADLVVSMSRVLAFMRIAIEALACGTPIISNNTPLATYSSPERLVENVRTFRFPKSRNALRRKALPFNADLICPRVLRIIESKARE